MSESEIVVRPSDLVTVTKMNHITEIQYMEHMNTKQHIKKISTDEYLVLDTGEVKQFEKTSFRSQGKNSLYQTFKKLRYLINNNFTGAKNELFITLTFEKDEFGWRPLVSDTIYLSKVCKSFQEKLKRTYGHVEFIRVLEPHEDGHAHFHMLIKFVDFDKIFIPNLDLNKIWGLGFVVVNSLKDVDNIGAYVSAYLADIEVNETTEIDTMKHEENSEILDKNGKKFIKGGRLKYYPRGVQIYNKSKGVVFPDRVIMKYSEIKKITGNGIPDYEKNIVLEIDDFSNKLRYESYNSKRL